MLRATISIAISLTAGWFANDLFRSYTKRKLIRELEQLFRQPTVAR